MASSKSATALWRISAEVVLALAQRLGEPLDAYVNGTQTWLTGTDDIERPEDPDAAILEWRLHPVAAYAPVEGVSHYELWELVVASLPGPVSVGDTIRSLDSIWGGLECFQPFAGDDRRPNLEPAPLAAAATALVGIEPEVAGLVDHGVIGAAWERANGNLSIVDALLDQLRT